MTTSKPTEQQGQLERPERPLHIFTRIACGLIFIAAAIVVLLNIFGIITLSINIGIFVALTALAIVAVYSLFHLFWPGVFYIVATMIVIMNANDLVFSLDGIAIGNLYIAATLLTIAFYLIFHTFRKKYNKNGTDATFGVTTKYFEDELDHASLECNFGAVKAYFDNATPKGGKAHIDIDCNFGGIELYVPKSWKVIDNINSTFSGTEEKNHPAITDKSPTLTLTGEINFGGLVITYV